MLRKVIAISTGTLFLATMAMAAPVKMPLDQTEDPGVLENFYDGKLILGISGEYDKVFERKLDVDGAENVEAEFDYAGGEISLEYDHKIKLYGTLGQAMSIKFEEDIGANHIEAELEDSLMWGVGLSVKSSDIEWIDLFTDVSFRQTTEMDYESVDVNGTTFSKSQLTGESDFKFKEWHVAVGISKSFAYVTPYAGVRYSDVDISGEATTSIGTLDANDTSADQNVGVFAGLVLSPATNVHFNVQGRFIDETAVTGSATLTF